MSSKAMHNNNLKMQYAFHLPLVPLRVTTSLKKAIAALIQLPISTRRLFTIARISSFAIDLYCGFIVGRSKP